MIRVGFILTNTGNGWLGGVNYLSNLLHAIFNVPDRQIEPVLIVSSSTPEDVLRAFPRCRVLRTELIDREYLRWRLARKLCEWLLGRDILIEKFLRSNGIKLLSHSGCLGRRAKIPTIGWIPDFQHKRVPSFFQPEELVERDRVYRRITKQCTTVLLSSVDAQNDLSKFDVRAVYYSRVLHFVAGFSGGQIPILSEEVLRKQYDIVGPYFYLPNQFWIHKNHRVVIDALELIKSTGQKITVICTGHTKDRRWPEYFDELMSFVVIKNVVDCFRVIGLVPYEEIASLMKYSVAVINPSLFEGWSTTVEETKSLGLTIIASDIPVHREQNPERAVFFDPNSAIGLADALRNVLNCYAQAEESIFQNQAKVKLQERFAEFGNNYQTIVLETLSRALKHKKT